MAFRVLKIFGILYVIILIIVNYQVQQILSGISMKIWGANFRAIIKIPNNAFSIKWNQSMVVLIESIGQALLWYVYGQFKFKFT